MKCGKKYRELPAHGQLKLISTLTDEASHTHTHPKNPNEKERKGLPLVPSALQILAARVPLAHADPQPTAQTKRST